MAKHGTQYRAYVDCEISIHAAIAAVEHFAANYPAERLDDFTANRLEKSARLIRQRVGDHRYLEILQIQAAKTTEIVNRYMARIAAAPAHAFDCEPYYPCAACVAEIWPTFVRSLKIEDEG